jgi:hypothetical protein
MIKKTSKFLPNGQRQEIYLAQQSPSLLPSTLTLRFTR